MKKVLLLIVLLFTFVSFIGCKEEQKEGSITILVQNLSNENLYNKEIDFNKEDTLFGLLKNQEDLKIKYTEDQYGVFITSLCDLDAKNEDQTFWCIYVNDESSLVGISEIVLKDNDVIKFVLTKW